MYIRAKKELFNQRADNCLAILSQDEERIFILNETASKLWNLSFSKISIEELAARLKEECTFEKKDLKSYRQECLTVIKQNPELFEVL